MPLAVRVDYRRRFFATIVQKMLYYVKKFLDNMLAAI